MADNTSAAVNYRYGVRGVMLAVETTAGAYGAPWFEPSVETIEESQATQNGTTFHSNDGNAATVNGATGNETMNATFAEYTRDYNERILGHKYTEGGTLIKNKDDQGKTFCAGYELQGTRHKTRVWKLGLTSSEISNGAHQSNGENVTESPQSATWTVNGLPNGDTEYVSHEGDADFEHFLDAVPTPVASAGGTGEGDDGNGEG